MRTSVPRSRLRCFLILSAMLLTTAAMLLLRMLPSGSAAAQEPVNHSSAEAGTAEPEISEASKEAAGESAEKSPEPIRRDQAIYIPYEKLRKTFEREGRGVFLPYDEFQQLWNAAQVNRDPTPTDAVAPVDWVIRDARNVATVESDVVRVRSEIEIEILKRGWFGIPLRLGNVAILEATFNGEPARIVPDDTAGGGDVKLLVENPAEKEPRSGTLVLELAAKIERSPGRNAVAMRMPSVPVSRWTARILESGVDVTFSPLIAATLVDPDKNGEMEKDDNDDGNEEGSENKQPENGGEAATESVKDPEPAKYGTMVHAFVGAAPEVRIEWTARVEGATGLDALAGVQTDQNVTIGESVQRNQVRMTWTISRAEIPVLAVKIPADQKIINVFDPNVKQWGVETVEPDAQKLTVTLFEPARRTQTLLIETEKFSENQTLDQPVEVTIPVFEALDVARQQGLVSVRVERGIRAEILRSTAMLRVDASESGGGATPAINSAVYQTTNPTATDEDDTTPVWSGAWQYATAAFELALKLEKVQPRISVRLLNEIEIRPDRRTLRTTAEYLIEDAGTFDLSLDIPEGYEIRYLGGRGYNDVQDARVAGWTLQSPPETPDGPETRVAIRLSRRTRGKVGVQLEMVPKREDNVDLNAIAEPVQKPDQETISETDTTKNDTTKNDATETTQRWRFVTPTIMDPNIAEVSATVVVLSPERLQVLVRETTGAQSASPAEVYFGSQPPPPPGGAGPGVARANIPPMVGISTRSDNPSQLVPIAAMIAGRKAADLEISATPRRPQVIVRQFMKTHVDEGQVQYDVTLFYDIRYSGISQLRVAVPESIASTIQIATSGIHDARPGSIPADLAAGYVVKAFRADSELFGRGEIRLSWKERIASLEPGRTRRISVPRLVPLDVTSAWGQIGIAKAEAIDVTIPGTPESETTSSKLARGNTTKSATEAVSDKNVDSDKNTEEPLFAGLQPIDPRYDLMAGVADEGYVTALSFFGDTWSLAFDVTRYALESPADTSVERALVQMVVTRSQKVSAQAVWRFRSARQRLALWLPPGVTLESQPRLDGRPVVLEKGDAVTFIHGTYNTGDEAELVAAMRGTWFYVPVSSPDPNRIMILQVRYTIPVDTGTGLRENDVRAWPFGTECVLPMPQLGEETPIQKMVVQTWVPGEFTTVSHGGSWSRGGWELSVADKIMGELFSGLSDDALRQRTAELADFPIDGTLTVFQAVGPTGDQPLELRYMRQRTMDFVVFGVTLFVGVLVWFVPRSMRGRLMAIGAAGIALAVILMMFEGDGRFSLSKTAIGMVIFAVLVSVCLWALSGVWMAWRCCRRLCAADNAATWRRWCGCVEENAVIAENMTDAGDDRNTEGGE